MLRVILEACISFTTFVLIIPYRLVLGSSLTLQALTASIKAWADVEMMVTLDFCF
jgi:hypothetical protein